MFLGKWICFRFKLTLLHNSLSKNLLTIYGNVKTESIKGNISADNIEIDISKRTVDLSMFGKGEVKVIMNN